MTAPYKAQRKFLYGADFPYEDAGAVRNYHSCHFAHIMKCTADPAELRNMQQSGVILLTQCILDMPSYTYALKAQRLLRARGYPCSVKRREKSAQQSCGYSLVISKNCRSAVEILDSYAIPYPQSGDGGAEYDKL